MFEQQQPPVRPAPSDAASDPAKCSRGGVAAVLARWTVEDPGPLAVAELARIDPGTLGEADRVRLVVALERQAAWLASLQLPALVAVGDCYAEVVADARDRTSERLTAAQDADPAAAAEDGDGRSVAQTVASIFGDDPDRWATMELATALHVAEFTAGQRLHLARVLPTRLPQLNLALRAGRVSYGHVLLVVRATEALTDELAREVDATLAPRYGTATPGGLRNSAGHAVVAVDPAGAAARHAEAVRRRAVSNRPESDGMATLALFHTAADISLLEAAICDIAEATATAAHLAGRLIPDQDALRADALIGLARYWLTDTWPIPEPDPRDQNDGACRRTPAPQSRGGNSSGDSEDFPYDTWHHNRPNRNNPDSPDDPEGDATGRRHPTSSGRTTAVLIRAVPIRGVPIRAVPIRRGCGGGSVARAGAGGTGPW